MQCTATFCMKWRYLAHMHDPASLPEHWACHMNTGVSSPSPLYVLTNRFVLQLHTYLSREQGFVNGFLFLIHSTVHLSMSCRVDNMNYRKNKNERFFEQLFISLNLFVTYRARIINACSIILHIRLYYSFI